MKRTILTTAALAAVILLVPAANANGRSLVSAGAGPADWDDTSSWYLSGTTTNPGTPPDDGDSVTIRSGHQIDVASEDSDAEADHISVESSGTLYIEQERTLTLDGTTSSTSYVDGLITLVQHPTEGDDGSLEFTTTSHTLSPTDPNAPGSIVGQDQGCLIALRSNSLGLISEVTIRGALTITEVSATSTSFINNGAVEADTGETLEVSPGSIGDSSGSWEVSAANGRLWINSSSSATHDGTVTVGAGTLDVDATFQTTSEYTQTGGTLDVAAGVTFSAS
jgi:hypothetical protein